MVFTVRQFAAVIALASTPLAGCAYAHEGPTSGYSEILSELPANAPPGECYAKVVAASEPAAPPPVTEGAVWVINQTPAGPVYCLVPTGPVVQPVAETVTRYGWIRVLCDQDATPERITRVQARLHERGYYSGQVSGRYDRATVDAVAHFQAGASLNHGGYLSLETLSALDAGPVYSQPSYAPPIYAEAPQAVQQPVAYGYASAYGYQTTQAFAPPVPAPCNCGPVYAQPLPPPPPQVYYQQAYVPPVYAQQQVYAQQAYAPPCCAAAPSYGYSQGASGGYGFGASAYAGGAYASAHASVSVVQNGWLTWSGKGRY